MAWRKEATDEGFDFIWDGVEMGIAPSPIRGIANIQNANISTDTGEILASFNRVAETPTAITNGTLTAKDGTLFTGPANLSVGQWISVSASSVTSINTTTSPTTFSVDYLVVGGGGGGGGTTAATTTGGGGGGGGGSVQTGTTTASATTYSVVVGAGGAGGSIFSGTTGSNSSVFSVTATGGGGGGTGSPSVSPSGEYNGKNGGSGGGGGGNSNSSSAGTGGTGTTGGNNGGDGRGTATGAGGGGGGAGAVGSAPAGSGQGGSGGNGIASSISGTSVTYGGGGGGGGPTSAGTGGTGGGGEGGKTGAGSIGTTNTGGGGGGGSGGAGGAGGSGIVIISYTTGSCVAVGGDITVVGTKTIHTFTKSGAFTVLSIPKTNLYFVSYKNGTDYKLSAHYDPSGANPISHGSTGSLTFSTVAVPNKGIAKAKEIYQTASSVGYRYYVLDANSRVWVNDSAYNAWMLTDPQDYSAYKFTGMAVLNGYLMLINNTRIFGKPTVYLDALINVVSRANLNNPFPTHTNFAYVGEVGKMFYCDANYIGQLFPDTTILTGVNNVQSYCSYTASSTAGTITSIISGSLPYAVDAANLSKRIPATFFTDGFGTLPTALNPLGYYYILYDPTNQIFKVYADATSTTELDIQTGATGNQYFNTFAPFGSAGYNSYSYTSVRLSLPAFEIAQCMIQISNTIIIGCASNVMYSWNGQDALPSDAIYLPEKNVKAMVNANNMAYVFAGVKGNVYITNGQVASLVLKVPDYVAGVPGSPLTYIEPNFTWGDATYMRGRVYFSIMDQTATKAGNCGGVWSFVPSQNFFYGQDTGLSLRLENQNSYGSYNGMANLIIARDDQSGISPQYWTFWQSALSAPTYGIDNTGTVPVTNYVVETDFLPTGTMLTQDSFTQLEFKLSTPLAAGDSVEIFYRTNSTNAWTSAGTLIYEASNPISGYYEPPFQKTQWVQFRFVATTNGTTTSSFVRLTNIYLRQ